MKFIFAFFLVASTTAWGQSVRTFYFDIEWNEVSKDKAWYTRFVYDDFNVSEDYGPEFKLVQITTYSDSTLKIKQGLYTSYYDDGATKKIEGFYKNDIKSGEWYSWTVEGHLKEIGSYGDNGKREGSWCFYKPGEHSPIGNYLIDSLGTFRDGLMHGAWNYYHSNGKRSSCDIYEDGRLISQTCWSEDENEVDCKLANHPAHYKGYYAAMEKFIKAELNPPKIEKKRIKGTVYVSFTIDENGIVGNIEIQSSTNSLLDAEAIRLVQSFPEWTPATQHGRRVSSKVTVPIFFV